ncbi:MAG: sigma-70 family RNA polymerase sigma factor, partial [Terriglobia bacterium]
LVSARNRSIDRLRRRKPATAAEDERIALPGNLESELAQKELISKVRSALDALAAPQRQALELAYFEGMTHSEIAERTGQPLGTVKTRLRAALETLRQVLNP